MIGLNLKSGEIVVQVVSGRSVLKLGWSYFASAAKLRAWSRQSAKLGYDGEKPPKAWNVAIG